MSDYAARYAEFVGVYHADGGPLGEARYILGRLLGTAHCALCDITHTPVRRKASWDEMVARLGVPFRLLHLNELPPDIAQTVDRSGSPVVLARHHDGSLTGVLAAAELEALGGSVDAFRESLTDSLRRKGC